MLYKILQWLDVAGPLLATAGFLLFTKKPLSRGQWLLLAFLLIQLAANSMAKILMLQRMNNIFVYQVNVLASYTAVSAWFLSQFRILLSARWFGRIRLLGITYGALLLLIVLLEDNTYLNSLSYTSAALGIGAYCIIFYTHVLSETEFVKTTRFWAATAFFIYFSVNFFIFFAYKLFLHYHYNQGILWFFHNFILCCCTLLIFFSQPTIRQWKK
jgi:hypothetical protein